MDVQSSSLDKIETASYKLWGPGHTVSQNTKGTQLKFPAVHILGHVKQSESSSSSPDQSAPGQTISSINQLASLSPDKMVNIRSQYFSQLRNSELGLLKVIERYV